MKRCEFLCLRLLLIRNHLLQFSIGLRILLVQFLLFDRQLLPQISDLCDGLAKLIDTRVDMPLLLLKIVLLLANDLDILRDTDLENSTVQRSS